MELLSLISLLEPSQIIKSVVRGQSRLINMHHHFYSIVAEKTLQNFFFLLMYLIIVQYKMQ